MIIERHFTLNQDWKGIEHKISLLPDEMKQLVIQIMQYKNKEISDIEKYQRKKLKANKEVLV